MVNPDLAAKKKSFDKLFEVLREIFTEPEQQQSIQEIIQSSSRACDDILIKAKEEGLLFVDGRFTIEVRNEETFLIHMKSYFQKKTGEWVVKDLGPIGLPLAKLDEVSRNELLSRSKLEFEMKEPQYERRLIRHE